MKAKRIRTLYTLIQCLYWVTAGLMFNFASAYLLDRGFSNSQIGVVLGAAYALSAVAQPLVAALFNRSGVRLSTGMACFYAVAAVLAVLVLALPLRGGALAVLIVCIFMLQATMQPSLNSLHRGYALRGVEINFGFARGMGSAAYSVMCALVGRLLYRFSPRMLPVLYLSTMLLMIACLLAFRAPSFTAEVPARERRRREPLLRRYPRFALLLLGVSLLATVHIFIDNFMLQIVRNLGGGSAQQGVVIAIAAMTELPAMVLYGRLSKRMGGGRVLCMAAWVWVVKDVLTALATSPAMLYAISLLQFASYAFYVPAAVEYVSDTLPRQDFLAGQALVGTAFTLGSLAATFVGGWMLDLLGVRGALSGMQAFSIAGAVLLSVAVLRPQLSVNKKFS